MSALDIDSTIHTIALKMAVTRFNMASNKKSALMKQNMREIAKLLGDNKEESARIKAEALIRDDGTIEAYEILQLTCDLLFERIKLISSSKTCPEDLKSSIATLIWASDRVDIKELNEIRKQFKSKFGKQFDTDAIENKGDICNDRIVAKLSVQPPTAFLVQTYLEKIADQFGVDWQPANRLQADQLAEPMAAPVGYSVQVAPGTGLVAYPADTSGSGTNGGGGGADFGGGLPPAVGTGAGGQTQTQGQGQDDVSEMGASIAGEASVASAAASASASLSASATSTGNGGKKKDKLDDIPVAQVIEADIYIPPAPGAGHVGATDSEAGGEDSKPSADDDFDELQARFNNLKK